MKGLMGLNMKYLLWQLKNLTHYLGFHGGLGVEQPSANKFRFDP